MPINLNRLLECIYHPVVHSIEILALLISPLKSLPVPKRISLSSSANPFKSSNIGGNSAVISSDNMTSFHVRYVFIGSCIPASESAFLRQILIGFLAVTNNHLQKDVEKRL